MPRINVLGLDGPVLNLRALTGGSTESTSHRCVCAKHV